jgi:hypothetical protein
VTPWSRVNTSVSEVTAEYQILFWRWRQLVGPKQWYLLTRLHGVTSKKETAIFTLLLTYVTGDPVRQQVQCQYKVNARTMSQQRGQVKRSSASTVHVFVRGPHIPSTENFLWGPLQL